MASAERAEVTGFLTGEVEALLFVKETWGPVFERMIEPLVRQETTWGDRPWPTRSKDQVALFGEYLSKDPAVVPALIAAVTLGVRNPRKRGGSNQFGRRLDQLERLLGEYFDGRGRNTRRKAPLDLHHRMQLPQRRRRHPALPALVVLPVRAVVQELPHEPRRTRDRLTSSRPPAARARRLRCRE
jgi:hypothetical protein